MTNSHFNTLTLFDKGLGLTLIFAIIVEIILFPSIPNFFGCLMSFIVYWVFSYFFTKKYVILYPFAFLMYIAMFLYRYLPLIATVIENHPITYGFENPNETFFYEIVLFLVSSIAFYLACEFAKHKNNYIQKTLANASFFSINREIIWGMGIVGLVVRIFTFSVGEVENGDVSGKFLLGLMYLMNAPLVLYFPNLLRLEKVKNNTILFVYSFVLFVMNIASNSREHIILPICTFLILLFIHIIKNNINILNKISGLKLIVILVFLIFGFSFLSDLSSAMIYTRGIREDVGKVELLTETLKVYSDDKIMKDLHSVEEVDTDKGLKYVKGWTEVYIGNFMLNRFANLRISDQTIYYAKKNGFNSKKMYDDFFTVLLSLFPTNFLNYIGVKIDKSDHVYSRGDVLRGSNYGSFVVTSHVGDGLATFGNIYFLYQFIVFFLVFVLLNCLVFYTKTTVLYSPFGLMNVFVFLGMFRNANGISQDLSFVLRGFWQGCFTYLVVLYLIKNTLSFFEIFNSNSK